MTQIAKPQAGARVAVAIVCNTRAPYRMHVHRRIARELPQIHLLRIFTHAHDQVAWAEQGSGDPDIILFGEKESSLAQGKLRFVRREWAKGGRIIRLLEQQDVKAVVVEGYTDACRMRIIRWCHGRGVPCFLWGDSNIKGDRARGVKALIKRVYLGHVIRSVTGVFACGSLGQAYFAKYGARPGQTYLYPVEPDYELITELSAAAIESTRDRFALNPDRKRIIYSGRLVLEKRVDLLIAAFARIAADRPDWDLVIVGTGPMRETLEAALPPHLRGRILWTGFLDRQEVISALYRLSDVLVLPSDYEPWSLVINEAAAAGLAIVSSDAVGAAAELVRDGVNGRVFEAGNLDQITACLLDVTNEGRAAAMKSASPGLLAAWRQKADPVQGLRTALQSVNVIPRDALP